jgi:hypothetical protein
VDIVAGVVELARELGLVVAEPVCLRSTNNIVLWLRPSAVVAKVSVGHSEAAAELAVARALADRGAPVVPPARGVGDRLHRLGDSDVTFWRYASQDGVAEPGPLSVARALGDLHGALAALGDAAPTRRFEERMVDTARALDRRRFAPELPRHDRSLLRRTLERGLATLATAPEADAVVHGSPHRLNILTVAGSPRFVDFATVARGRREWDLAHLEPEVADHYPGGVDADVLAVCRLLVSAATSAWCWDGLDRGPDMRHHAELHLAAVRAAGTGE